MILQIAAGILLATAIASAIKIGMQFLADNAAHHGLGNAPLGWSMIIGGSIAAVIVFLMAI